jgi:hypothetical protein
MLLFVEIWSNEKHLVEHIRLEKVEEQRGKVVPTFDRFLVNSNGHELSIFFRIKYSDSLSQRI